MHSRCGFLLMPGLGFAARVSQSAAAPIGRQALARRHNPVLTAIDPRPPLSVGNGEFAFTADVTGLQSLPDLYEKHMPWCTQSQWGWHSFPMPGDLESAHLRLEDFDTYGRPVGYATSGKGQEDLFNWRADWEGFFHSFLSPRAQGGWMLRLIEADFATARKVNFGD